MELAAEIGRLCEAQRFADARDFFERIVDRHEEEQRSGNDCQGAERRLARCLNHFALFLAHCPDQRSQDLNAALKQALRATQLQPTVKDYWFTLAEIQYRHGDWQDSQTSLGQMRMEMDAIGWYLSAMNLYRLGQKAEAQKALQKGLEWVEAKRLQAKTSELLRYQLEIIVPEIEEMRREAENLLEGKNPTNVGVAGLPFRLVEVS
jgi:hypothetical protein